MPGIILITLISILFLLFLVAIFIFISRKKRSVNSIAAKKTANLLSDSIMILNTYLSVVNINKAFKIMMSPVLNLKLFDSLFSIQNLSQEAGNLLKLISESVEKINITKSKHSFETKITIDGFPRLFSVEVSSVGSSEKIIGYAVLFIDITEVKAILENLLQKEQNLTEKKSELETLLNSKNDFISVVSHELITPLNVINTAVQTMYQYLPENNSPRLGKYIEIISHNIKRQLRLINNVLDITRFNAGQIKISYQYCDLVFFVRTIVKFSKIIALRQKINIHFSSDVRVRFIVSDFDKIQRILFNLISNAIKFSDKNTLINIELHDIKSGILIRVTDGGLGIPDSVVSNMFDDEKMLVDPYTKISEGAGIGLMITSLLAKTINIRVTLIKSDQNGSTFEIFIPSVLVSTNYSFMSDEETIELVSKNSHIELSDIDHVKL